MAQQLQQKVALVFAAAGAVGSAVARRLAGDGFAVHCSGRSEAAVRALADEIGGLAARVDATDDEQVSAWVDGVAARTGRVDLVFDAIGLRCDEAGWARPSTTLPLAQFLLPLQVIVGSQFSTARAAGRHMVAQGHGSIVTLSASLTGLFVPCMANITAAHAAVEGMTQSLAAEFGPHGVRVNCVRAAGMPEARTIQETSAALRRTLGGPPDAPVGPAANALRRAVTPADVAALVSFLASESAGAITGQVWNVCGGELV